MVDQYACDVFSKAFSALCIFWIADSIDLFTCLELSISQHRQLSFFRVRRICIYETTSNKVIATYYQMNDLPRNLSHHHIGMLNMIVIKTFS